MVRWEDGLTRGFQFHWVRSESDLQQALNDAHSRDFPIVIRSRSSSPDPPSYILTVQASSNRPSGPSVFPYRLFFRYPCYI